MYDVTPWWGAGLALIIVASSLGCSGIAKRNGKETSMAGIADTAGASPFSYMLGINGFEWEFLNDDNEIDSQKTALIRSFGGFRHYLDWGRIETEENCYAYQPSLSGSWGYDDIYTWCKNNGLPVLVCIKTIPDWLKATYPEGKQDVENAPLAYGVNKGDPASYRQFAKMGFQFAARYGSNQGVDTGLVSVAAAPEWSPNQQRIGLGLVKYIECNNEPDRWWKGEYAHQTAEEYAANLSAFYDGHLGELGPGVGVKSADSSMTVIMGGLTGADIEYLSRMVEWCRLNRGYRPDGTVNLCFDVINYHYYTFSEPELISRKTRGAAPERSSAADALGPVMAFAREHAENSEVWVTELGYDINQGSPLRAVKIGNKTPEETHADWSLRSSLFYARHGVKRLFFFMLNDVDPANPGQFSSSGFVEGLKRRPSADYFRQVKALMGAYVYSQTIAADPMVDVYVHMDDKIYVLTVPDEQGREMTYDLSVGDAKASELHVPRVGSDAMLTQIVPVVDGKVTLNVTETPIFVKVGGKKMNEYGN